MVSKLMQHQKMSEINKFGLTVWVETSEHFHPHGDVGVPFLGPQLKEASVDEPVKLVLHRCVAVKVSSEHLKEQYE